MTEPHAGGAARTDEIERDVRDYVLREFLPGERPGVLTPSTRLLEEGVLDSIASVKLVAHLEERYGITFEAHEMGAPHLETTESIAQLVTSKIGGR